MTPRITQEQRAAIDDHPGEPIYVVDPDREQTYVLLTSADFNKVRPMLGKPGGNGDWTDEKNRRRVELIDRKVAGTITAGESFELADLQQQAEAHFDQIAPPPIQGVAEIHQQLLNRDRH